MSEATPAVSDPTSAPVPTAPTTPAPRTRLLVIDTPKNQDPTIQLHRETVVIVDGQPFARPKRILARRYSAVADATVTLASGKQVSVADLSEAISMFGDLWDQETK